MLNPDFALQRENVELWLEALESGRYKQGKGRLRGGDAFCCLGVAMDVLKVPAVDIGNGVFRYGPHGEGLVLTNEARYSLGLLCADGKYVEGVNEAGGCIISSLTVDNDGNDFQESKTFKEIAAIIRSRPEALFIEGMYDEE